MQSPDEVITQETHTISPPDVAPQIFGKYYLLDRVAVGGMAELFRAKTFGHSGFEKIHVIKRILGHYAQDPGFEAMFVDEAKLSVQLTHPNIVHIYDFGKIDSNLFLDMEAVDGKNLKLVMRRLAERGEYLPVKAAVYIAHEVAKGLDFAHKKKSRNGTPLNIVHRDISPANLLVSYDGVVKIVDFGIARADSTEPEPDDIIKGKFQYMSPEQAARGPLDHRSDLFSLGVCLWEMLTGHRLFRRENDIETVRTILAGHVAAPSTIRPEVPEALDQIVLKALAQDPNQRYEDCRALQRSLQDFLLPETPDRVAPELSTLLRSRFATEIQEERARLEAATALVSDLHYSGELDLEMDDEFVEEASPPSIVSIRPADPGIAPPSVAEPKRSRPGLVALLLLVVSGVGLWMTWPTVPTTASLSVTVSPLEASQVAKLTLDGESIEASVADVAPDIQHVLRVEAEGFVAKEKLLELVAGQSFAIEMELSPEAAPEPTPVPASIPAPDAVAKPKPKPAPVVVRPEEPPAPITKPIIVFESEPSGARVFAEGRVVGRTPFAWTAPDAETVYPVEFRLPGHSSTQAVARSPANGEEVVLYRELEKKQEEPTSGRLSVTALPGWARVYIDGEFVKTTPLYEHELKPGTYDIRLSNERLGVDINDRVTIGAGDVTRKSYRLDE